MKIIYLSKKIILPETRESKDSKEPSRQEMEVTIKVHKIGKIIQIITGILQKKDEALKKLFNIDKESEEETMQRLPDIILENVPVFADILAMAIDDEKIDADFIINKMLPDELAEIIETLIEINNVEKIYQKKMGFGKILKRK